MSTDIKSKTFFLTYSRPINPTNNNQQLAIENYHLITLDNLVEFLRTKGTAEGIIASKEQHQDGTNHYHILITYDKPIRIRRSSFFDHYNCHPNIQSRVRNTRDVWNYVSKYGDIYKYGIYNEPPAGKQKGYSEILNEATNSTDFLRLVRDNRPRDFILNYDRLQQTAQELFRAEPPEYTTPENYRFNIPLELQAYLDTEFQSTDRPRTLVLVGNTRVGKTVWARSLGVHNYMNSMFNLDEFDMTRDYLVLDDIEFDFIPARKAFFFGQKEFTLTDKYRKKKKIVWGKPTIYLCNVEPDWNKYPDPYEQNCIIVHLYNKLF